MEFLCVQKVLQSLLTHFLWRLILIFFFLQFFLDLVLDINNFFLAHLLEAVLNAHLDKLLPINFSFILVHQNFYGVFVDSWLRSILTHLLLLNLFLEQKLFIFVLLPLIEKPFFNLGQIYIRVVCAVGTDLGTTSSPAQNVILFTYD